MMKKCSYSLMKYALKEQHKRGYEFSLIFSSLNLFSESKLHENDKKYKFRSKLKKLFMELVNNEQIDLEPDYYVSFTNCIEINYSDDLSFFKKLLYKEKNHDNDKSSSANDSPLNDLNAGVEYHKSSI